MLDPSNNKSIHLIETKKKYGQSKLVHSVLQMKTNKKVGDGNGKIKDIPTRLLKYTYEMSIISIIPTGDDIQCRVTLHL